MTNQLLDSVQNGRKDPTIRMPRTQRGEGPACSSRVPQGPRFLVNDRHVATYERPLFPHIGQIGAY